jgi:hypothetical protein
LYCPVKLKKNGTCIYNTNEKYRFGHEEDEGKRKIRK